MVRCRGIKRLELASLVEDPFEGAGAFVLNRAVTESLYLGIHVVFVISCLCGDPEFQCHVLLLRGWLCLSVGLCI